MIKFLKKKHKEKREEFLDNLKKNSDLVKDNIDTVKNTDITDPGDIIDSYDTIMSRTKPVSPGGATIRIIAKSLKHGKDLFKGKSKKSD